MEVLSQQKVEERVIVQEIYMNPPSYYTVPRRTSLIVSKLNTNLMQVPDIFLQIFLHIIDFVAFALVI